MKLASKTPTVEKQPSVWSQVGFRGCFMFFAAIFLFANVNVFASIPVYEREAGVNVSGFDKTSLTFSKTDAHHPFEAGAILSECEVIDETNPENELDGDGPDSPVGCLSATAKFYLHSNNSLFLQLELASESRATISLFVLHHCWRSFLI